MEDLAQAKKMAEVARNCAFILTRNETTSPEMGVIMQLLLILAV